VLAVIAGYALLAFVLAWGIRTADARLQAAAPPGTFFAGRFTARARPLRAEPRFASLLAGYRGTDWFETITMAPEGILFAPRRRRPGNPSTLAIAWDDLTGLQAVSGPGAIDFGLLSLQLRDGSRLRTRVRGYARLFPALDRVPANPRNGYGSPPATPLPHP
jgi:hypothetical protein